MRSLALIFPAVLLCAVALLLRAQQRVPAEGEVKVSAVAESDRPQQEGEGEDEGGMRWVSHDWVEVDPLPVERRRGVRRQTFGLDRSPGDPDPVCLDVNCRACLIDFVYGREF